MIFHELNKCSIEEEPSTKEKLKEEKDQPLVEFDYPSEEPAKMKNQSSNCEGQTESGTHRITMVNG